MRTRVRGLSAAVLLCAAVPTFAQDNTVPLARQPRTISLQEAMAIATEKANAPDVRVECWVLCVSGKESRAGVAKLFDAKGEPKTAFLSADEVKELLTNCIGDKTTNVLQAPAITLPAGEVGRVKIVDSTVYTTGMTVKATSGKPMMVPITEKVETGTTFSVVATPTADGKNIALKMAYHDKQAKPHTPLLPVTTFITPEFEGGSKGQPIPFTQFVQMPEFCEIKVQQTGKVPDGGTMAVLAGRQTRLATANDDGVPMISQIPYLNRLFKNAGQKTVEYDVVVLTTAKRFVLPEAVEPAKVVPAAAWGAVRGAAVTPDLKVGPMTVATVGRPTDSDLAKILADYQRACNSGNTAEAARLAVQALAKDPTCFGK